MGMLSAVQAGSIPFGMADCLPASLAGRQLDLAYHRPMANAHADLQVYNVAGAHGFVVKAGNQLIGYSTEGTFDPESAAPAMLAWLEAVSSSPAADATDASAMVFAPVEPLLGDIAWNQDAPYNDLCPKYDLSNTSPTGCVATAMAQVMRYHQWPEQGTGSHSYQPAVLMGNSLTADFGQTQYDWAHMLPTYDETASAESRHAVAELMLHCGVSVDMVYYTQSGAMDYDVPPALSTYFGYCPSMAYRKREHYGTADWLGVIHQELMAGHPVLAYGRATLGGHAYVFDGMDSNGLIHVNWGWGGVSNGYFQTSALTPPTQGIGGSDGGFNYSQRIITGIEPMRDDEPWCYAVELTSSEGLNASRNKISNGAEFTLRLAGKIRNQGWRKSVFDYGAQLVSMETGKTLLTIEGPQNVTLDVEEDAYAPTFGTVTLGTLADGDYRLYPVCRDAESSLDMWQRIRDLYIGYPNYLDARVSGDQVTFGQPDYFDLKATVDELPARFYSSIPACVKATVINEGDVEYHGEVKLVLYDANRARAGVSTNHIVDLLPGQQTSLLFTEAYPIEAGNYALVLIDDDGQEISNRQNVSFVATPAVGTPASAQPLAIELDEDGGLCGKAQMQVNEGLFAGLLYTYIYDAQGQVLKACLDPEYFMVSEGECVTVVMKGIFEHATPGTNYLARLVTFDGIYTRLLGDEASYCLFTYGQESGIELIGTEHTTLPTLDIYGRPASAASRLIIANGKVTIRQ